MATTTNAHGPNCNCTLCDPLNLSRQSAIQPQLQQQQQYNNAINTANNITNGVFNGSTLGQAMSPSSLRSSLWHALARVLGLASHGVEQRYIRITDKTPVSVFVDATKDDANVARFVLGRLPEHVVVESAPCFMEVEDLPEQVRESVMLLQAGYGDEPLFKLARVGTIRKVAPGVLYFSVFI